MWSDIHYSYKHNLYRCVRHVDCGFCKIQTHFDNSVCDTFRFVFYRNVTVISSSIHGNGNQNIRIAGLGCTGREPHIAACKFHGWGHIRCSGDKAVGVICGNIYKTIEHL